MRPNLPLDLCSWPPQAGGGRAAGGGTSGFPELRGRRLQGPSAVAPSCLSEVLGTSALAYLLQPHWPSHPSVCPFPFLHVVLASAGCVFPILHLVNVCTPSECQLSHNIQAAYLHAPIHIYISHIHIVHAILYMHMYHKYCEAVQLRNAETLPGLRALEQPGGGGHPHLPHSDCSPTQGGSNETAV